MGLEFGLDFWCFCAGDEFDVEIGEDGVETVAVIFHGFEQKDDVGIVKFGWRIGEVDVRAVAGSGESGGGLLGCLAGGGGIAA